MSCFGPLLDRNSLTGLPCIFTIRREEHSKISKWLSISEFGSSTRSVAGLGGCPFAPGSPGNVSTGKVVSALHARGYVTGVDEAKLAAVARRVADMLGRRSVSPAQATCE